MPEVYPVPYSTTEVPPGPDDSGAVPVKATGAEVDTGTDDAKFVTAKALTDSDYIKEADLPVGGGGVTNSAGNNVVPKSDGTNLVASSITDNGTSVTFTENILASPDGTPAIGAVADNRFKMFPAGISLGGPAYQAGEARFGTSTNAFRYQNGFVQLGSAVNFGWASSDPNTTAEDVNLTRASAGVIQVGDGSANANGHLMLTTGRLRALTVATLPAGTAGWYAYVTDGDAGLAWGATVVNTGAGATKYLVWFNGTNWTVAGK